MSAAFAAPPMNLRVAPHLDLRAPEPAMVSAERSPAGFPSPQRRVLAAQEQLQLPGISSESPPTRIPGRIEEFARRVHREGLPVARLWENKSALVSLGLNQKGKPGLWIIQKIH